MSQICYFIRVKFLKKYIKPAFLAQCSEQEHTSTDSNVGNFIMDDVKVHLVCSTKEATDYTVA